MRFIRKNLEQLFDYLKTHLSRANENSTFYILIVFMLVLFVSGMNIFLNLAEALQEEGLNPLDSNIQDFIVGLRHPAYTPTIAFITDLGDRYAYMVVVGIMLFMLIRRKRYWLSGQVLIVSGLSAVATVALKHTYDRPRPTSIEHLVEIGGLSFPSGHALSSMAFYGFVIYLIFRFVRRKWLKISLTVFCILLILAIGLSRIYLGVHYPSDVAAGFVGGLIWASFCIIIFNLIELWQKRKKRRQLNKEIEAEEV